MTGENVEEAFQTISKMILTEIHRDDETTAIEQKSKLKMFVGMIENISEEFCEAHGDYQKGSAIIKKIFADLKVNMKMPTKEGVLKAIERIAQEEEILIGADVAKKNKELRMFKINRFG